MGAVVSPLRKSSKIPTLEAGAADLLLELSDEDVSISRIVELVRMSPSIAARLVATANSAWSRPVAPVTSIADACSRLGLNVVRTTSIALAIGQSFSPRRCPSFDAEKFWCTSIMASNLAADLAGHASVDANTARTAALLHNIGLLWLADSLPAETNESLVRAAGNPEITISQGLQDQCGSDRRHASLFLYENWNLPDKLKAGWEGEDHLGSLISRCEAMATDVFENLPLEEVSWNVEDPVLLQAYEKQVRALPRILQLSAAMF